MADLNELKPVGKLNPFAKFCCTIGNLPTSYMISLTYEEQLLWLCKYLEDTVIPAVNTNAEAVQELQELYVVLKNYVDQYFENLDVQEEINNKLDEMVIDGTLQSLLLDYSNITKTYNTLQDLINDNTIVNNMNVKTLGYNYINDGGNGTYKITNEELIPDGGSIIQLSNNLYAKLICTDGIVNVKQFGAKGNDIDNDTIFIQNAINYVHQILTNNTIRSKVGKVILPAGIYHISSINLYSNIILEGSGIYLTRIKPITPNVDLINLSGSTYLTDMIIFSEINNLSISPNDDLRGVGNKITLNSAIKLYNTQRCKINNVTMSDIEGFGIAQYTNMDCYIDRLECINVDSPILFSCSEADVTNAIHISNSRFENCINKMIFSGLENRYIREIYLINSKFENTQISFTNTLHININNCHFTDTLGRTSLNIDNTYNVGINVTNCSFTSPNNRLHKICSNNSPYYVEFNSISVSNCYTEDVALFNGTNIKINNSNFVDCTTPIIDCTSLLFSNNTITDVRGDSFTIILHDNSICTNNIIKGTKGISMNSNNFVTNNYMQTTQQGYLINSSGNLIIDRGQGSIQYNQTNLRLYNKINRELTNITNTTKQLNCNVGTNNVYGNETIFTFDSIKKYNFSIKALSYTINNINTEENENITIKYTITSLDETSTSLEKTFTANTGNWLSDDDFYTLLLKENFTPYKLSISAKSNLSSTNATIKSKIIID